MTPSPQKQLNENLNYPFFVSESRTIIKTINKLSWVTRCNVTFPIVTHSIMLNIDIQFDLHNSNYWNSKSSLRKAFLTPSNLAYSH
jgi:hypothetical protein